MGEIEPAARQIAGPAPGRLSPYFVSSVIPNMAACEVAINLGVHGPVTASALACASGIYALLEARRLIASGEADVVICGGTDASITPASTRTCAWTMWPPTGSRSSSARRAYRFAPELPVTATGMKVHDKVREMAVADDAAGVLVRL